MFDPYGIYLAYGDKQGSAFILELQVLRVEMIILAVDDTAIISPGKGS